jgi:hypothetical protein
MKFRRGQFQRRQVGVGTGGSQSDTQSRRESNRKHCQRAVATHQDREGFTSPGNRGKSIQPSMKPTAQEIEVELITQGGAHRSSRDDTRRVQVSSADQRRRRDECNFSFNGRCNQDPQVNRHQNARQRIEAPLPT